MEEVRFQRGVKERRSNGYESGGMKEMSWRAEGGEMVNRKWMAAQPSIKAVNDTDEADDSCLQRPGDAYRNERQEETVVEKMKSEYCEGVEEKSDWQLWVQINILSGSKNYR